MKTVTTTLIAASVGFFGLLSSAEAQQPYGNTVQSIASGGCYGTGASDWQWSERSEDRYHGGEAYRPQSNYGSSRHNLPPVDYSREDYFHTLPASNNGRSHSLDRWEDNCDYVMRNQPLQSTPAWRSPYDSRLEDQYGNRYDQWNGRDFNDVYDQRYNDPYDTRYNDSPRFEAWRPMNAWYSLDRQNW